MLITVLKSKIAMVRLHRKIYFMWAQLPSMKTSGQANIRENEKVQVVNLNNGERLERYAIKGKAGSKVFGLNGAAARKAEIGDQIFIISYAMIDAADKLEPIVIDLEHDLTKLK